MIKKHTEYEKKWQDIWYNDNHFRVDLDKIDPKKKKTYVLDMFPYPSGKGIHVGHVEGYTASDIYVRYRRHKGDNVFTSMGFDAFGLPAEQYALETGNDPRDFTYQNINNFIIQLKRLGKVIDWEKSFATCDSNYYEITQKIFKLLYENNLAELKDIDVNFCPKLGTVLANDEIILKDGLMFSERGEHPVYKKAMKQWVLLITKYANKLLSNLSLLDWSKQLKEIQTNWIGKKEGAEVYFNVIDSSVKIKVFTTRPDTIYGVSHLVLAPEHKDIDKLISKDEEKYVKKYLKKAVQKSSLEREISKKKTGVFLGTYAINPINNEKIPIWTSDYVIADYAEGAVMAVPAHDERDYEFAKKFGIPFKKIIDIPDKELPYTGDGIHINSDIINGLKSKEATSAIIKRLEVLKKGKKKVSYKLRDWTFSRQRYWGEPFPLYYDSMGNITLVPDKDLPLLLPEIKDIKPSGDGKSPLANVKSWTSFTKNGKKYSYDTNTMPQLAGSSWYYLAHILKDGEGYLDMKSKKARKRLDYWLPVDLYIGGKEHAVGHLLYSRFFHMFLSDLGYFKTPEPFKKLVNQGMILLGGHKMSKSKGNVISPDVIFDEYGADTLRMQLMFLGPIEQDKPWNDDSIKSSRKFLDRVIAMFSFLQEKENSNLNKVLNVTIKKVDSDYNNLAFNTAISQMMIFVNSVYKEKKIGKKQAKDFLILLNPIAPHLTEELNEVYLKSKDYLFYEKFPKANYKAEEDNEVEIIFQVNGKLRGKEKLPKGLSKEKLEKYAKKIDNVKNHLKGKTIIKVIYVPDKILNFVVK